MRSARLSVLAAIGGLVLTTAPAAAEDEERATRDIEARRSSEIIAHMDRPETDEGWLAHHLERLHVHKKTGLAYTRSVDIGRHDLRMSVRGPALGRKKRLGLSFEIRF